MKLKKTSRIGAAVVAAIALTSAAQAAYIVGSIDFGGGLAAIRDSTGTPLTSSQSWILDGKQVDFQGTTTVNYVSGTFAAPSLLGNTVVFNQDPWTFSPLSTGALWTVGGFTFNVQAVAVTGTADSLVISGTGTVTGNDYQTSSGTWRYSNQRVDDANNPTRSAFSWSSSATSVPDGGTTIALLGLSLLGLHGVRRKFAKP